MNSARMLSERIKRENQAHGPSMQYGDVQAVHEGDKVLLDVQVDDGSLTLIPMTTACQGVEVGDRVVVMTVGRSSIVTGVLARDNGNYIKELWSNPGGLYMNASQSCQLSEPVSAQRTGIVLHWQAYIPGDGVKDYQHNFTFVPKTHVQRNPGKGVGVLLMADSRLVTKYIYVGDVKIDGNDQNAAQDTISGVSINNRYQVLTQVLGV